MPRWEYLDEADRFWRKVDRRGDDECWPWLGSYKRNKRGEKSHGQFGIYRDGKTVATPRASRVAYRLTHGDPGELHVLHKCNNPGCCNPAHLYAGTNYDNVQDAIAAGTKTDPPNNGKLNEEKARVIRQLDKEGYSRGFIAEGFGVSYMTVWAVCTGRTYRDVD